MVYFDGWYEGALAKAEDWYTDNLVYISIKRYDSGARISAPAEDKSYLVRFNDMEMIRHYPNTIVSLLSRCEEFRDESGRLIPIEFEIHAPNFQKGCSV